MLRRFQRYIRLPHSVLEWVPVLLILVLSLSGSLYAISEPSGVEPFRPISLANEVKVTALDGGDIINANGPIILYNGICNRTQTPVSSIVTMGFQTGTDPLVANRVIVIDAQSFSFPPGCTQGDPLQGTLPAQVTPGLWSLYGLIEARGEQAGQIQRISIITAPFKVIP